MSEKEYDDFKKATCRNCGEKQRDFVVELLDEMGDEYAESYCENCAEYEQHDLKWRKIKDP